MTIIKIGITGYNLTDGMGDIVHILNVGQTLSIKEVTEVTYHVRWDFINKTTNREISLEDKDVSRLNQLVDKLKYLNIIPEQFETGRTIDDYINNINKATYGKFKIVKQSELISESQDLWVSVSYGIFSGDKQKYLDYVKYISIMEHQVENIFGDIIPNTGYYDMGIGGHNVGILLDDNIDRTIEKRTEALGNISNSNFHMLLKEGNQGQNESSLIKTTEFIPVYIQHMPKKILEV